MLKIKEAIVVEGRYDKNTLSQLVDGVIVETTGFGIYHNKDLLALLRRLGEKQGLIVLTDSDGAGFQIRSYLKSALPPHQVKHAYIPDRPGKERRKRQPPFRHKHHDQAANKLRRRADDRRQCVGQALLERRNVVRDAA